MNTYIDKDYLAAHDTLISYSGNTASVDVPEILDKIRLSKIGDGAFSELTTIESVKLPYGVSEIGDSAFYRASKMKKIEIPGTVKKIGLNAFGDCNELSEIIWYDIELSDNEYTTLKNGSSATYDNIFVAHYIPRFVKNIGSISTGRTMGDPGASVVPKEISVLFRYDTQNDGCNSEALYSNIEHISFLENDINGSEHDAFVAQVKLTKAEPLSVFAENANDYAIKSEKNLLKLQTYIFMFDDKKTCRKGNKVYITATIKFGYFFWQSKQKVICDKKDYYIYRRHFLTNNPEIEYVREDAAIYCNGEVVTDRKEAQKVYGKYKLLSIL